MLLNYYGPIDPLDCIKRNKQDREIVAYLKNTGIDGFKLADIIYCEFGLRHEYGDIPYTEEERKRDKKITSVKKAIKSLCNNSLILDEEKKILCKIQSKLITREKSILHIVGENKNSAIYIKKDHSGSLTWTSPLRIDDPTKRIQSIPHAKSKTQALGLQMAALFDYIQIFNIKKYQDQEIYGLIAALYEEFHRDGIEYSTEKIKQLIDNNSKNGIYKKFKASKTFLHFQRDEFSMRQIKKLRLEAEAFMKNIKSREDRINAEIKENELQINKLNSEIESIKKKHKVHE